MDKMHTVRKWNMRSINRDRPSERKEINELKRYDATGTLWRDVHDAKWRLLRSELISEGSGASWLR